MVETLTAEEDNTLYEFRKLLKNEIPTDVYDDTTLLCKFLRARNFNLKQAESMLKKSLRWRKEMQVDTILTDYQPPEVLQKYVSQSFIGFDKTGCPIRYAALGNTDGKGLFKSANKYNVLKCIVQVIEEDIKSLKKQTEKLGKPVTQCVYIYDMEHMTLAKATHKQSIYLFMDGIAIIQDNYPEMLKRVNIINASLYFTIAFTLVKTVLAGALLDKIKVFGENGWKEELLNTIDADVLPAFLGGNRTDPDGNPRCKTFMSFAGTVPESYYLTKDPEKFAQKEGVQFVKIDRQSSFRVEVDVKKAHAILNWEWETKYYDIGFGVHLVTAGDTDNVEVIPVYKIETENEPHTGFYRCEQAGTYHIVFDNTYSWFYSKDIYYRTWVTDGDEKTTK